MTGTTPMVKAWKKLLRLCMPWMWDEAIMKAPDIPEDVDFIHELLNEYLD